MYDPRNNPIAGDQPVVSTGDAQPVSPSGSDLPPVATTAGGPLPVSPSGADIQPATTPAGEVIPIPGQGLAESLHGNVEDESGIFYGEVGVDRDIDATASHTFSDGHHPLRNPVPETTNQSDLTYLDDTEVSHQGVATAVQLGTTAGTTATALQTSEQGANTGDPRYALSPDTAVDPPQDLESEGRIGTEVGSTLQDNFYGAGEQNQSVSTSASGPISQMDAPSANIALGAYGMPGGQQLEGEQAARMQPPTQGGSIAGWLPSAGRPQQTGNIHVRGGDSDGFAYEKQDDQNPEPTEDIAGSLGEKYIATSVSYHHGEVHANLAAANVAAAITELRSIGIQDADIAVLNEGNVGVVKVKVDNLNRPYVEQTLHKYGK